MKYFQIISIILFITICSSFAQEVSKKNKNSEGPFKTEVSNKNIDSVKSSNTNEINSPDAVGSKMSIKDNSVILMEVENEGTAGSIILPDVGVSTTPSGDKLYNKGGSLY